MWKNGLWETGLVIRDHYPSPFLRIGEFATWDIRAGFLHHVSDLATGLVRFWQEFSRRVGLAKSDNLCLGRKYGGDGDKDTVVVHNCSD